MSFLSLLPLASFANCTLTENQHQPRRNSVEKMKNAKHADISAKSKDCQLQSMSQTRENGISTPLVDSSLMRHSPQLMGEPPDGDDTDPDVIPNQYGECWWRCDGCEAAINFNLIWFSFRFLVSTKFSRIHYQLLQVISVTTTDLLIARFPNLNQRHCCSALMFHELCNNQTRSHPGQFKFSHKLFMAQSFYDFMCKILIGLG